MTDIFNSDKVSTKQEKTEVINAVKEAASSLLRIDSERDLMKDIADRMKEEFEIKPSDFNKVVRMYHKQNRDEQQTNHDQIMGLYDQLFEQGGDNG